MSNNTVSYRISHTIQVQQFEPLVIEHGETVEVGPDQDRAAARDELREQVQATFFEDLRSVLSTVKELKSG